VTYRHIKADLLMTVAWRTAEEVGLCGGGFTWVGTLEAFWIFFRPLEGDEAWQRAYWFVKASLRAS